MPLHLLLVEDDLDLGASLTQALQGAGLVVEWVRLAADADRFAAQGGHDCLLLDLGLPDGHGLDLLKLWRSRGLATPLIVLTASDALGDRLQGLDEGADDFMVKPFAVEELISQRRECHLGGGPMLLSPREFDILVALARVAGKVVPKHRLAQSLQPLGDAVDFNAIEVHVHHLRRKLGSQWVKTLRGVGYALATEPPEKSPP